MILVTTPGKVGAEVARLLACDGHPVRVLARDPGRHIRLQEQGVDVMRGDLDDAATVRGAVEGVDRVVLVSPADPGQELGVIDAASAAGVAHVVKVTSKAAADSPVARRRGQHVIENGLQASGLPHTLLRANAYMQNILALGPVIQGSGAFSAGTGNGQVGLTDARDVAAVAVHVIADPAAHVGATYWVTGPELLSYYDVAAALSEAVGRRITFTPRSRDDDLRAMLAAGVPATVAENNATAFALIADGDAAWVSRDVSSLLGRPARSFTDFAREHAALFASAN